VRTLPWPGDSYPLGATYDGAGTNFALFSEVAHRVELCLFDDVGKESRVDLHEVDHFVWHGYLPGISPGQRYGYRQPARAYAGGRPAPVGEGSFPLSWSCRPYQKWVICRSIR
jgi:pullulanase/glycogen debranching enzyme